MSLAPLLQASPAIQIHAAAAMAAFALGLVQFALPKGTTRHRVTGWLWVTLMVIVSVTAFFIHELRVLGAVEPDPSARDFHADHAAARGAACAATIASPITSAP